MKTLPIFFNSSKSIFLYGVRHLRFLRKEFLGEYLPKVDEKHLEKHRSNKFTKYSSIDPKESYEISEEEPSPKMSLLYPEMFNYLPLPHLRDSLRERIERREMMKRHQEINVPEFYVGSIMAATVSDQFTQSKTNRFVGLCIYKRNWGLLSSFRLRNVIDNIGIEMEFELYNPTLIKVEVLKLEKRLDANLFFLRDAPYKYSHFPFDMAPVPHDPTLPVPVNDVKVKMNPLPWNCNWLHHNYRGIDDSAWDEIELKKQMNAQTARTSMSRYDLMMIYRERGPLFDKNMSMRHVEIMHHDLIKYQELKYKDQIAKLKRDRQSN